MVGSSRFDIRHLAARFAGKANPLQSWTGPDFSRRLSFPDFKTIGT
jgi:hypothetical protein